MTLARLVCGDYVVELRCPDCRAGVEVLVALRTRLQVDDPAEDGTLRVRVTSKAIEHRCRQMRLVATDGTPDPDADPAVPDPGPGLFAEPVVPPTPHHPDFRELAAGKDSR